MSVVLRQNKLLSKIKIIRKLKKKDKSSSLGPEKELKKNTLILNRMVEEELLANLYKINSEKLDKTKKHDARYGNGKCSNFQLLENNISIIKIVAEDLTRIINKAVKSEIYIDDSFFNILQRGSGTTPHNHITSFDKANDLINQKYSLTYYLSIGDQNCSEPGILKIYNPNEEILPTEGMIIIIPSNRMHSAIYNGNKDRVMIGINFYKLI